MSETPGCFTYRNGEMYCDAMPVREIAQAVGTPVYVYSGRRIASRWRTSA